MLHEFDVSIIPEAAADDCRATNKPHGPSKAAALFECKCYSNSLGLELGREFVGLKTDFTSVPMARLVIIVHIPARSNNQDDRRIGNFVAIEIKRGATDAEAKLDYESLALLAHRLAYPLTIFINIDSVDDHRRSCPPEIAEQTISLAVCLEEGVPVVRSSER